MGGLAHKNQVVQLSNPTFVSTVTHVCLLLRLGTLAFWGVVLCASVCVCVCPYDLFPFYTYVHTRHKA